MYMFRYQMDIPKPDRVLVVPAPKHYRQIRRYFLYINSVLHEGV